jgi:hypothetical protein
MRTIPAAVQTLLDADKGTELIVVIEVYWSGNVNGISDLYADREISGTDVKGAILDVPPINEAVQVLQGGLSRSLNIRLDDTDGTIKTNFDMYDTHKIPVRVSLYTVGTDFDTELVQLFLGQMNSPIEWDEGERTFSFAVVNRIEDVEIGFSAEEGNFGNLPEELIGQPWPLCFGTTINVKALNARPAVIGRTASGVGIKDFTLAPRLALANDLSCPSYPVGFKCSTRALGSSYKATCVIVSEIDPKCLQQKCVEQERLKLQIEEQEAYEFERIDVFGGENFPQGFGITVNINGAQFKGYFTGTRAVPSTTFVITERTHPDYDPDTNGLLKDNLENIIATSCPEAPPDGDTADSDITNTNFGPRYTGARTARLSWEAYREADQGSFFWAPGGSTFTLAEGDEILYIANIIPSTVKRVAAWRTLNGNRQLLTVPDDFYTVRSTNYGGYTGVVEIKMDVPLSTRSRDTGGGWSDDIYISQVATLSNNPVTIMSWLITTYTDYSIDTASFADATTKLANYPFDWPQLTRPTILSILQNLARFSRCALWQKDDTFFIKYLAEEPTPVDTIGEDDILVSDATQKSTLKICLTKTEDLVTKLTARWQNDHALDEDKRFIMRRKVSGPNGVLYGTHEKEEDYFPYAHLSLVRKSVTFWMLRWANTWKRLKMSVPMEFLKLEPFDAVTVDVSHVSPDPIICVVEKATVDTKGKQIDLELWTPLRAGEVVPDPFAWPSGISANAIFPTQDDVSSNFAGSGNEPNFSTIAPPGHPLRVDLGTIYKGFSLACNGRAVTSFATGECRQDYGDARPSDIDDTKPTQDIPQDTTGDVSTGTSPIANGAGDGFFSDQQYIHDWNDGQDNGSGRTQENITIVQEDTETLDNEVVEDVSRDFLDDLPDPDDLDPEEHPCQASVTVAGFDTVQGYKGLCFKSGGDVVETYVFDQNAAAVAFCEEIKAGSHCGSGSGNGPCTYCANCSVSLCPDEEEQGDGAIIAFRTNSPKANFSFMDAIDPDFVA